MLVLGYVLAAAIGLSLGLLGGGGSILTVPILVYVLHFDPKLAIVMSLPVVGVTSLASAIGHWRAGHVRARTALSFGLAAVVGAYAGARVAVNIPGTVQLTLLAIIMLVAAASMFRSSLGDNAEPPAAQAAASVPDTAFHEASRASLLVVAGLGVGALTGLLGIGGGFLVVPTLVILARVPITQAVGTSLVVIAANCASAFAGYAGRVALPWLFVATFTAVAVAGGVAGTYLVRFVSQRALKRAFAVFLIVMAAFILVRGARLSSPRSSPPGAGPPAAPAAAPRSTP